MKWFNYILSLYLLVLSCIPCADEKPVHSFSASSFINAQTESEHPVHTDDACSPLCICTCCSGFTIQTNALTSIQTFPVAFQNKLPFYKQAHCQDLAYSIWQPPKLS
jgi:hypothetical protein